MYVRRVARLAKTTQMALDELDGPCAADEISGPFMRRVRVAMGGLPAACFASIERVATAVSRGTADSTLPIGYGASCVRHFSRRTEQLTGIVRLSIERRFALIE